MSLLPPAPNILDTGESSYMKEQLSNLSIYSADVTEYFLLHSKLFSFLIHLL
jgi:hypothetical protein